MGLASVVAPELPELVASEVPELVALAGRMERGEPVAPSAAIVLDRLRFPVPSRAALPVLGRYGKLVRDGAEHLVGYTEASRGCKHLFVLANFISHFAKSAMRPFAQSNA